MIYRFFDKKSSLLGRSETLAARDKSASVGAITNENMSNKELSKDLQKPIIRNFNKRKIHSPFIESICRVDLADIQLIIKFKFLFY